jgi:hypothetical protein
MAIERGHLLSCATEGVDLAEVVFPLVDKQGCVTVKTNLYSVPAPVGSRVEAWNLAQSCEDKRAPKRFVDAENWLVQTQATRNAA